MAEEELFDLDTGEVKVIHKDPPKKPPQPNNNNDYSGRRRIIDGRTILRRRLTPYLPPPVVRAIGDIDPLLEPYVGPEASITIASSLLLSFLVLQLIQALAGLGGGGGGKAIADNDDDDNPALAALNQIDDFGDTVILCGPMWSGKTRIFNHLCYGDASLPTVMSLRANAAVLPFNEDDDDDNNNGNNKPLRVLDYPGHSGLQDSLFVEMIQAKPIRFVLVVDSTQSLAPAADFLYDLLQHAKDTGSMYDIFVACHKCDLSSSKNPRRLRLTLRQELEKLIKVRSTKAASAAAEEQEEETRSSSASTTQQHWWTEGEALDMDELKHARLRFEATTCNVGDGIDKMAEFCKTGAMD